MEELEQHDPWHKRTGLSVERNLRTVKEHIYKWISVEEIEPSSACIIDVLLLEKEFNGLRETYPAYKNPKKNDEWCVLFTNTLIKDIAGDFKIINWMPFPESKV